MSTKDARQLGSGTTLLASLEAHLDNLASSIVKAPLLGAACELPVTHLQKSVNITNH